MAADRPSTTLRRLLMTGDAVGGVWQYSLDLLSGIASDDVEIVLAIFGPPPSETQREQLSGIPKVRLEAAGFALEWMENPWTDVDRAGDWLLHLAADFKPDLIHLNGYCHAALPWKTPHIVMAHSCVRSWWRAVHNSSPGMQWNEYGRRVIAGLRACDAIVAPSRYMAGAISDEYNIPIDRIRVIHNSSAARVPGNRDKHPVILAAGRIWDEAKNIRVLVEAAPDITWQIRIAGESNFSGTASLAGLDRIEWLGKLPHECLLKHMAGAAIFAHPAVYEPFGLSVLEAAKAGCALVLSDIPPMRELWEDAAVFVAPRDPTSWIVALNNLISNCAAREQLGYLARRRALNYSRERCIGSYTALYQDVIRPKSNGVKEAAA